MVVLQRELRQAAHSLNCGVRLATRSTTSAALVLDFIVLKQEDVGDAAELCKISVKEGCLETSLSIELLEAMPQAEETFLARTCGLLMCLTSKD